MAILLSEVSSMDFGYGQFQMTQPLNPKSSFHFALYRKHSLNSYKKSPVPLYATLTVRKETFSCRTPHILICLIFFLKKGCLACFFITLFVSFNKLEISFKIFIKLMKLFLIYKFPCYLKSLSLFNQYWIAQKRNENKNS